MNQRTSVGKQKMEPKNTFTPMKQGVLQDESMGIHVVSMLNDGKQ